MRIMLTATDTLATGLYVFSKVPRVGDLIDLEDATVFPDSDAGIGLGLWEVMSVVHTLGLEEADHRICMQVKPIGPDTPPSR